MQITIDIEKMTIGDLLIADKAQRGEAPLAEAIEVLDKVTNIDITELPVTKLGELLEALGTELDRASNPQTPSGN